MTSLHVVDNSREVTVVFKPANPNGKANADEVVTGDVVKVDVQRDLALIQRRSLPRRSVRPLDISTQDIEVGADVHAIGHPLGQGWTYTKESSVQSGRITNGHTAKVTLIEGRSSKLRPHSIRVIRVGPFCRMTEKLSV